MGIIAMFWISKYLQCPIHVGNKNNGRIMSKIWNEYNIENFHLVYGNNHFEPITMHNQIVNVVNVFNYNKNNQTSKKLKIK